MGKDVEEEEEEEEEAYTAEEVAHKDDQHPARDIAPRIQALEGMRLAVPVQHDVVLDLAYRLGRRQLVVGQHLALEVARVLIVDIRLDALPRGSPVVLPLLCP